MLLLPILAIPLLQSGLALLIKDTRRFGTLNAAGHTVNLFLAFALANRLSGREPLSLFNFFFADALSGFFILAIAVVNVASSWYSTGYMQNDLKENHISDRKAQMYYVLFNLFTFTMYLVTVMNNLGFVWVSIEMTTLVSAFLVGFYNDKKSVEAAWKYLILCSVGITIALLGTILFYYTLSVHAGIKSLNWTDMVSAASRLDANVVKVAFLFILVGYGTKAGLAPMHSWLPDAHSQAPAPISALLSGVLLKTSIYAIMRFMVIANKSVGVLFAGKLLILFGILSLVVAAGLILVQKDLKRLLAYSSIEHIGIIAVGLGIGGPLGLFGALFHTFNHAVNKSLMFFGAGEIVEKYRTHNMRLIRGAVHTLPFTGILVMIGAFALAGSPPFAVFFSEIMILVAGVTAGKYAAAVAFLFLIAVIFGGIIYHFSKILFGKKPEDMMPSLPAAGTRASFIFLLIFIAVLGVAMPAFFKDILVSASKVLQ
jgi:hydrogenase-4 component F